MKTKLLFLTLDFNYTCGVSKHVFINLKYLSKNPDYELYFITNKGDSIDRLNELSHIKVSFLDFEKDHINIFKLISNTLSLFKYCKENKIDIIHTHHRYVELLAVIVSKFYKVKTLTTVHSFVKGLTKISFHSNKIITVSNSIKSYLNNNYPHTRDNSNSLYNCVEEDFFHPLFSNGIVSKSSLGFNEKDKVLLFIGRNSKVKGLDVLISSLQKKSSLINVKLLVVGFDLTINEMILSANIKFIGTQKDVRPLMNLCDIVIIPSREDPFPYVMLEAAAMKKPIIGSKTGGIAEFIDDEINGTLFENENIDQLADKIEFAINNIEHINKLAEKLSLKAKQECNCQSYFKSLTNIYTSLLSE